MLSLIDDAVAAPVVIFGSLPPHGRDLDLLVREPEREACARALGRAGFESKDARQWVRFAEQTAWVVDLQPVEAWRLPPVQADRLFDDAPALEGRTWVRIPSAHHQILILARLVGPDGALTPRRRARLAAAAEDPHAWARATELATAWRLEPSVQRLRALESGEPVGTALPARRAVVRRAAGAARPRVVAICGIDGSGKSTQARALCEALDRLGHDAVVAWAPLAHNQALKRIARPVARALRRALRRPEQAAAQAQAEARATPTAGSDVRAGMPVVNVAWMTVVAVANAWTHVRTAHRHAAAGRIVIFDRYVLDSAARLRFFYGDGTASRIVTRLIAVVSPRPVAAFHLEIDPDGSRARKDDGWTPEELRWQARLYGEEQVRLGTMRLDAARPPDELAALIARETWQHLG